MEICVCLRVCFKENSASVSVECMYINVYFFSFGAGGTVCFSKTF